MYPNADRQDPDISTLIELDPARDILELADQLELARTEDGSICPPVVMSWLRREAHLAIARCTELISAGMPAQTAAFLAQDDLGFQFARAASEWFEERLLG